MSLKKPEEWKINPTEKTKATAIEIFVIFSLKTKNKKTEKIIVKSNTKKSCALNVTSK